MPCILTAIWLWTQAWQAALHGVQQQHDNETVRAYNHGLTDELESERLLSESVERLLSGKVLLT